jgi:low temperature requirement protein LtrA
VARFQRARREDEEERATSIELFFDLVFVFAVTQVSHLLLHHLSLAGAGQSAIVLLVVWWAWNYTTWVTNELDPDSTVVRLALIAITLAALLMAIAIPQAFRAHGLLFAGSYVAIQVGRHLFLAYGSAEAGTLERERAVQILIWFVAAGVLWLAGGILHDGARIAAWLAALVLDYGAPLVVYRVPGRTPLGEAAWDVETAHFAERFQLFVIIALGESLVVTGATTSDLELTPARAAALVVAFLTTAVLWWLYFDYVARIAQRRLERASNRTRMARDGYTYLHVVMIAGIIVAAVGDALLIARPGDTLPRGQLAAIVAGPALYLAAHVAFRLRLTGTVSRKRLGGALGCLAAGLTGAVLPALAVAMLVLAVLAAIVLAERVAARRRSARGEPGPIERLGAATRG